MNKQKLLSYLNGGLSDKEKAEVVEWIESSENNMRYFSLLKNLTTINSLDAEPSVNPDIKDLKRRLRSARRRSERGTPFYYFGRIAAVLAIPMAAAALWFAVINGRPEPLAQSEDPYITVYTPLCAKAEVVLPDGTKVWLNSDSRITYPRFFEGDSRQVELNGEAYFDVHQNKSYPFVVKTPMEMEVIVTGTSFNLSAYAEDRDAEITLVNGSVELLDLNRGDKMRMKPRQLARYIPGNTSFDVEDNVDTDLYTAWRDGILVFDNVDLQQFIRKIERWYGVEIVIGDTKLLNYTYTGKFKEETIRQVLELMKQTSDLDYKISDKEITLTLKKK